MPIRRAAVDLQPFDEVDAEAVRGLEQNASADNYLHSPDGLCVPHLGSTVREIGAGRGDLTERLGPWAGRSGDGTICTVHCRPRRGVRFAPKHRGFD